MKRLRRSDPTKPENRRTDALCPDIRKEEKKQKQRPGGESEVRRGTQTKGVANEGVKVGLCVEGDSGGK